MALIDPSAPLPLFPLPNVVHFPTTNLKLHIFEPRYRRLVRDLLEASQELRLVGMVLIKPGSGNAGSPEIFRSGTAGMLVDVESFPDGRSNIVLHGDFRFEIEREVAAAPYRRALVRAVPEPALNEADPGILSVRRDLTEHVTALATEIGERFPLKTDSLREGEAELSFEQLVNYIAAEIDLPALSKLSLLSDALPERALSLLGILRNRRQALELLRPFRHLATDGELN